MIYTYMVAYKSEKLKLQYSNKNKIYNNNQRKTI